MLEVIDIVIPTLKSKIKLALRSDTQRMIGWFKLLEICNNMKFMQLDIES